MPEENKKAEGLKKAEKQNTKKQKKLNIQIKGVDIDKNEYQEIILSNSNHPERTYFKH